MADSIATVVNWYGPYKGSSEVEVLAKAKRAAKDEWSKGLYAAIGSGETLQRGARRLLYMGVGNPLHSRLVPQHHQLSKLSLRQIWLGEVGVPGIPGKRPKKIDTHLDMVEWASAFFLELPFNKKKRQNPPGTSCVVVNRWWETDFETSSAKPLRSWPDIIEYDVDKKLGNLVWFAPTRRIKPIPVHKVRRPKAAVEAVD
jgi:hypothetical protein